MQNSDFNILLVDDERNSTQILRKILEKKGYKVTEENDSVKAKKLISERFFDIIISDLQMPGISGLELLKAKHNDSIFIMITGYGSVVSAVESMKNGAFDYINKPFNIEEFTIKVEKAADKLRLTKKIEDLKTIIEDTRPFKNIIGTSKKMQDVFELINKISKINVNILIEGQSGTGKELVARAIHQNSNRSTEPFIAINCSAIPENLLESELFGHAKGAFTGATDPQKGVFEQANGGTLFLDEIAEMPYNLQAKLLRVTENWEVKPLGSDKIKKIDIRLISATNQNIKDFINKKRFREDLYFRLATVSLILPTLNERTSDIPLIVNHYLKILSAKFEKNLTVTPAALDTLIKHQWKGNIRELENVLEQAAISTTDNTIDSVHFGFSQETDSFTDYLNNTANITLDELQKQYIAKILSECEGNKAKAAQLLGIDRKTLYRKVKEFNIPT